MAELLISRRDLLDLEVAAVAQLLDPTARASIAATVSRPDRVLRLLLERTGERAAHDIWLGATLVVHHPEVGLDEPVAASHGPSALFPSLVGRLVELGPRQQPQGGRAVVGRVELADAIERGHPVAGLGPIHRVWTLQVLGTATDEGCTVIDQGPSDAIWRLRSIDGEGRLCFEQTSSLQLWAHLGRLLRPVPQAAPAKATGSALGETDLQDPELAAQ